MKEMRFPRKSLITGHLAAQAVNILFQSTGPIAESLKRERRPAKQARRRKRGSLFIANRIFEHPVGFSGDGIRCRLDITGIQGNG